MCVAAAAVSGTALLLSDATAQTGLFQRIGLTAGQLWIAGTALAIVCGRLQAWRPDRAPERDVLAIAGHEPP